MQENGKRRLNVNTKKTFSIVISKAKVPLQCSIFINGNEIQQVESFFISGQFSYKWWKSEHDINQRIGKAKTAFGNMKNVLLSHRINLSTRLRVLYCCLVDIAVRMWNTHFYNFRMPLNMPVFVNHLQYEVPVDFFGTLLDDVHTCWDSFCSATYSCRIARAYSETLAICSVLATSRNANFSSSAEIPSRSPFCPL